MTQLLPQPDGLEQSNSDSDCRSISSLVSILVSIYLYLPIYITPKGDVRQVPVNHVLGASFSLSTVSVSCA